MVHRGNRGEQLVTRELELLGYIVGSRRHLGGAGDLVAWRGEMAWEPERPGPLLIEVKARLDLWQGFRASDRALMIDTALSFGLVPLIAWLPFPLPKTGVRPRIVWLPASEWPT